MKKSLLLFLAFLPCVCAKAQTDGEARQRNFYDPFMHADTLQVDTLLSASAHLTDSLTLPYVAPSLDFGGYGWGGFAPLSPDGLDWGWRLHKGFNAQLSMSVSAAFGKHAPRGIGFGQTAAFAWLQPITPRLSVAAGVFASNMDWGAWRQTNVGVMGAVAYQATDRINLYVYGAKTFLPRTANLRNRHTPFPIFFDQLRDRIGAAAEFKIGENASIGVSVERSSY